jgi:hypothetical protein
VGLLWSPTSKKDWSERFVTPHSSSERKGMSNDSLMVMNLQRAHEVALFTNGGENLQYSLLTVSRRRRCAREVIGGQCASV